jgi:hypothetical protein
MFIFSFTIKILSKMKKKIMSLATIGLVIAATVFSVSVDAKGHLSLFKKASAVVPTNDWIIYVGICPSGNKAIIVCGSGGNGCIPSGTCPPF